MFAAVLTPDSIPIRQLLARGVFGRDFTTVLP